ncbi:MAG: SpoIIE family protein phosphatase [Lachnospiraceae bacterium]|nr:SpoIIE family protein phosphatase [Lachnospiraceae bacterium]
MKEQAQWLAKTGAFLLGGLAITAMAGQSGFALSAVETLMYVLILVAGYRLGTVPGTVAGIFCGLARISQGESGAFLPACLMAGALSGLFRRLGRKGSLTAFLCGFILGSLTGGPIFLADNFYGMCGGGLIFLLIPEIYPGGLDVNRLKRKSASAGIDYEQAAAVRLHSIGEVLALLSDYYKEVPDKHWEPGEGYSQAITWYTGYLEEKMAASVGMGETARLIGTLLEEYQEMEDVTGNWEGRVGEALKEKKILLERLNILKDRQERLAVALTVRAMRKRCIPVRELAAPLSRAMGRELRPEENARAVIGQESVQICFREDPGYHMLYDVVRETREDSETSGDNFSCMRIGSGKAVLGLSDGMGTGEQAAKDSEAVMDLAEKLLMAGYGEEAAARLINAVMLQRGKKRPVTLDLATVDLFTGDCCFTKLGAVTTFLRREGTVETIRAESLPAGILAEAVPMTEKRELGHGDMIVMVTDGVLDALAETDKEASMMTLLSAISSNNPRDIARQVLDFACRCGGKRMDDMTVLAAGIWKK